MANTKWQTAKDEGANRKFAVSWGLAAAVTQQVNVRICSHNQIYLSSDIYITREEVESS